MSTPTLGRREKLGSSVRSALNEQLGRVQIKHVAEVEVLDDMRNFLKQRGQIEREYSQSIQKLCQHYLTRRDFRSPPDLTDYSKSENRGILEMWKIILEKTEELGKGRGTVADMLQDNIMETIKDSKRRKEHQFKKHFEVAQKMICEVLDTVKDLATTKKLYRERWKMCEEARGKFSDADGRLKNSQLKLFESRSALERTQKKCAERLQQAQRHSTVARNEYLLSLNETNTHLRKHFEADIPQIMKEIDGDMYERIQEAYILYAQIEADSANKLKADFEDLREQSGLVNREYVMACFINEHSIFSDTISYEFESAPGDRVSGVSKEHGSEIYLEREARKYAQNLTKLNQSMVDKGKAVKGLLSVTQAYKATPEFGTSDATAEAQQNLFEIQEELRQISVQTHRINSRLDLLRSATIDVDKWLNQAAHTGPEHVNGDHKRHDKPQQQTDLMDLTKSIRGQPLSGSTLSLAEGDTASLKSEALTDAMSISSNFSEQSMPRSCVVLYAYQAQRPDELDIFSDEELEVTEWDNGDGWSKGKNQHGKEGYFPQSYVKPHSRSNSPVQPDIFMRRTSSLASDVISMNTETKKTNGGVSPDVIKETVMLRALFEYNAQDEEELSFPEGAMITLSKTDDNGVDDGWWEGTYEGKVGMFPSVVVERVINDTPQDLTPCSSEIFPSITPSESIAEVTAPPPPSYPAPEISVWDLTIGPKSNPSSTRPSPTPVRTVINSTPSNSSLQKRTVVNDKWMGNDGDYGNNSLEDSFDYQNSFEDTLRDGDQWSSFEDVDDKGQSGAVNDDDDVSYV